MRFKKYLEFTEQTAESFANQYGIGKSSAFRYCSGESIPYNKNLRIIQKATNGKVTLEDFYAQSLEWINELIDKYRIRLKMICPVINVSEPALLKKLQSKSKMEVWEFKAIQSEIKEIIKSNKKTNKGA